MAGTNVITSRDQVEITKGAVRKTIEVVTIDWVGDAADGSVPNLNIPLNGWLIKAITNPGSVAPTANYDIALGDPEDNALDAFEGKLQNRHTSTTECIYCIQASGIVPILLASGVSNYVLSVSNNAVHSATGRIILYLADSI